MPTDQATPKYSAFLSYSHADTEIAVRWHERLEGIAIPDALVGTEGTRGRVPHTLRPIFRDRLDFSANRELQPATREALDASNALILIATPNAARSEYVNEEVRYFRHESHPARPLVVILEGPEGVAFQDCMPKALRFGLDENGAVTDTPYTHLATDTRRDGLEEAIAKVVGDLVGLDAIRIKPRVEEWLRAMREISDGQMRLERLVIDAAGYGAPAVRAIQEFRDLMRPFNADIDAMPPERLPGLMQQVLDTLRKPGANPADFAGAVGKALAEAKSRIDSLQFADAQKVLDEELARSNDMAKGRAALLAERGRVAGLQLHYREAAAFYQAASGTVVSFDTHIAWDYATDAAGALYRQGDEFGDNAALTDSIQRYHAALTLVPRDRAAEDWASTQVGLGLALWRLGERESGIARLEQAVAAYRAALEEFTRDRAPLYWATTQNNLGNALQTLGARESGTARLEEAVAAYRAALEENTRDRVPLDWAMTQYNLAEALAVLAERTHDRGRMTEAIAAMRDAAEVYRQGNVTYWLPIAERRVKDMEAALAKMP